VDVREGPIGVFDSGVGGLAVLQELRRLLPAEDYVYYADQAHFPYGGRSSEEIVELASDAVADLTRRGAKAVVVACNTASGAALTRLRATFDIPIVGMEPALKPACAMTRNGRVGLLATQGTVQGAALRGLIERVSGSVEVLCVPAPGLVELVESGMRDPAQVANSVAAAVAPLREAGVDVVVLGCSHYAFLKDAAQACLGDGVTVLEPAGAVAAQAARVMQQRGLVRREGRTGSVVYHSTADAAALILAARMLCGGF
jgi:glutamate racemase